MHQVQEALLTVKSSIQRINTSQQELHFKVFSCLWAFASLFHMAQSSSFDTMLHYSLLTLAAIHVLFRPASVAGFVVLLLLQLHDVFYKLPVISNHWIFTAFVNLTILQALVYLILKNKTFKINAGEWLETFAPVVRIEVLILYFYVVFHKLNSGFFSTDLSCASYFMYAQVGDSTVVIPPVLLSLGAYGTIFFEALIPLLLCFRVTRNWGVLVGLLFHGMLGFNPLNGFYDFSSMIFAVYFLFAGPQVVRNIPKMWARVKAKKYLSKINFNVFSYKRLFAVVFVAVGALLVLNLLTKLMLNFELYFFWMGYSLVVVVLFIRSMLEGKPKKLYQSFCTFTVRHWAFFLLPALVFLNGLSPYLGLKTESSFAMFSNLRTEGGVSNHLLVPASLQLFNYQDDMIEIVASSDKFLQRLAEGDLIMNAYKFNDYVARERPAFVTYLQQGEQKTFTLAEAGPDAALLQGNPYWFRKLMNFREISKSPQEPCGH